MTTRLTALLVCLCAAPGADAAHIHMLSGSKEYKSDQSLPPWAERLREAGHTCTISRGIDGECVKHLKSADLLVVFCKRWKLDDEQVGAVKEYLAAGKPVIGIRTASHAFQTYLAFDNEVLGGTYSGHTGTGEVKVTLVGENAKHPVLAGLTEGWTRKGKIYNNPPVGGGKKGAPKTKFAGDNVVLMRLAMGKTDEPGTWVRTRGDGQRVFYTSMGLPEDFEDPKFRRLLDNAVKWCLE